MAATTGPTTNKRATEGTMKGLYAEDAIDSCVLDLGSM
jgi:hypothetical protein